MPTNSTEYMRAYDRVNRHRRLARMKHRYKTDEKYRDMIKRKAREYKESHAVREKRTICQIKWKPVLYMGKRYDVCDIAGLCRYLGVSRTLYVGILTTETK